MQPPPTHPLLSKSCSQPSRMWLLERPGSVLCLWVSLVPWFRKCPSPLLCPRSSGRFQEVDPKKGSVDVAIKQHVDSLRSEVVKWRLDDCLATMVILLTGDR